MTERNLEGNDGNLFSATHALKVAGVPYVVQQDLEKALLSKFVLFSSSIENWSFSLSEKEAIENYVKNGGTVFFTQLKDSSFFSLSGVTAYTYTKTHYSFHWKLENIGVEGSFIDDPYEKIIKLADSIYPSSMNYRSYSLSSATPLASYEDGSIALLRNQYFKGNIYLLGLNWKDIVLRNQVIKHFQAARSFSNGYEPGSDVFYLFLRGIFNANITFGVYKHTSVFNSRSILVITHDVDATSAINDLMTDFSSYEYHNNIRSTYFVTTHYMHDSLANDFWSGYADEIISVKNRNHEIASHSVSHVPDFENSATVVLGNCGNETEHSYQPFFNGVVSQSVTVCGEVEVSKKLLEREAGVSVTSFRAGYLAYNKFVLDALEQTGYKYNSTHSANNVLTAFPFQGHLDLSLSNRPSSIYEIPNTISDVFMNDRISEFNYNEKVEIWLDVLRRNASNNAPTVLLIHPNRNWKILAEQKLIRNLPANTAILPFEEFGQFWKNRESFQFEFEIMEDSSILIKLLPNSFLSKNLSLIVTNGNLAKNVTVVDAEGNAIATLKEKWGKKDLILFSGRFEDKYDLFEYKLNQDLIFYSIYPNPSEGKMNFKFELLKDASLNLKIYDLRGSLIDEPIKERYELGSYSFTYLTSGLLHGLYFFSLSLDGLPTYNGKFIVKN